MEDCGLKLWASVYKLVKLGAGDIMEWFKLFSLHKNVKNERLLKSVHSFCNNIKLFNFILRTTACLKPVSFTKGFPVVAKWFHQRFLFQFPCPHSKVPSVLCFQYTVHIPRNTYRSSYLFTIFSYFSYFPMTPNPILHYLSSSLSHPFSIIILLRS